MGGAIFYILRWPLPWVLGGLTAIALSLVGGFKPHIPNLFRQSMSACLGVMLGSGLTPQIIGQAPQYAVSIVLLLFITLLGIIGGVYIMYRLSSFDVKTSYFMAMPGGLTDMATIGQEMGADPRPIAISHTLRIIIVVWSIPWLLLAFSDLAVNRAALPLHRPLPGVYELLGLFFCLIGWPIAKAMRLPAAPIMGPLIISACLHVSGILTSSPPAEMVIAAQIVLGAWLGARFLGITKAEIKAGLSCALALTAYLMVLGLIGAAVAHYLTGLNYPTLLLAFAPGGIGEMSLMGLALHLEGSVIALHHLARIILVLLIAPFAYKIYCRSRPDSLASR
jgi:membrane AbrB-like protein